MNQSVPMSKQGHREKWLKVICIGGIAVVGYFLIRYVVLPAAILLIGLATPLRYEGNSTVLTAPPARMRYPVGYSGEIDLSGLTVELEKPFFLQREYVLTDSPYELTTDADFTAPGSYIVEVRFSDKQGVNHKFWFTVAVEEP